MVAALGAMSSANAAPITGTFQITVYQGHGAGDINEADQQAQQGNPFITDANKLASGSYTGAIDFNANGVNDIAAFLGSSFGTLGGTLAGLSETQLSSAPFDLTTVFVITGDVGSSSLFGSITHDDGASLYDGAGYSNLVVGSALPTVEINTLYSNLTGQFQLIFVQANGLPSVLKLDVDRTVNAPEPITLSLFGAGLAGLGAMRRRRKAA
jgi:hypothetical protein